MEAVIKDIQDTLTAIDELESRRSKTVIDQSERLVGFEEQIAECRRESAKFRRRTEQNLVEITDKLNRLIGYPTP